ncbi:Crp/Fnr family transcriptional regulator [Vibrio sp. JC009]|uniref:Crp/Fnr family transcriptional regulator n=1 Tax=Vibrio sp. JC009 TaxID=2912314 RepID=UPI0023B0E54E|nr:Crp/Fnr family transcriptional regulator [Vibrio sp. JC009]WED21323.1 Crp/Fnr family transcriptional regulator [Vibrio sp. JC009]
MPDKLLRELWVEFSGDDLFTDVSRLFLEAPNSVRDSFRCLNLSKGTTLFSQGDPALNTYIILDGEIVVSKSAENGKKICMTICMRGEFIGDMEILSGLNYMFDASCLTDVKIISINAEAFLKWLKVDHSVSLLLNRQMAKRALNSAEQRLMNAVDSVENNLLFILSNIKGNRVELSRSTLAELLCTTRRHVDKVIHKLKEEKLIEQDNGVIKLVD